MTVVTRSALQIVRIHLHRRISTITKCCRRRMAAGSVSAAACNLLDDCIGSGRVQTRADLIHQQNMSWSDKDLCMGKCSCQD